MFEYGKLPLNIKYVPEFDPKGFYGDGKIKALTFEGLPIGNRKTKIFAYLGIPEAKESKKLPAVVLLHGGGGHAMAEWVKIYNDRGYAAIAIDHTGNFPTTVHTEPDNLDTDWVRELHGVFAEDGYTICPDNLNMSDCKQDDVEKQWAYHGTAATIISKNILASFDCVDDKKIGVVGISWGGVLASVVMGYEPDFAFAIPVYGSGYIKDLDMGVLGNCFREYDVPDMWLAEKRFDKVKYPVFWMCWNDDICFSIGSNSQSYLDTKASNPYTALSMIDNLNHSSTHAWVREEIYLFSDSVIEGRPALSRIIDEPQGRSFDFKVELNRAEKLAAKIFYLTEPMTYSWHEKPDHGMNTCMDQFWASVDCSVDGDCVFGTVPEDATSYYVELRSTIDDREYITTSSYVVL